MGFNNMDELRTINVEAGNYNYVFYIIFLCVILFYDFNGISDLYDGIMFFLTGI